MSDAFAIQRANLVGSTGNMADAGLGSAVGECGHIYARQALHDDDIGIQSLTFRRKCDKAAVVLEERQVGNGGE